MRLLLINPTLHSVDTRRNRDVIDSLLAKISGTILPTDVLLLPEHFTAEDDHGAYLECLQKIARETGCTVVGGSHHRHIDGKRLNVGNVVDPTGLEIGSYEKLRPYFEEQKHVVGGSMPGEMSIGGRNILILICADFWYSDIILSTQVLPDVVLVPSLSVSRKPNAEYSRTLWRNLAVMRAYEFGTYVGISDWHENSTLRKYRTCGVGGFADPTSDDPQRLFQPVGQDGIEVYPLDFGALERFREDRRMRGFFWR